MPYKYSLMVVSAGTAAGAGRTTKRREYPCVSFPVQLIGLNLLLDITLFSISFRCRFVFVVVNIRVRVSYRVMV